MEKLIKHLRKELISTKESLRMAQDQLLSRLPNCRSWGELREANTPQGYEKLCGKGEASSGCVLQYRKQSAKFMPECCRLIRSQVTEIA